MTQMLISVRCSFYFCATAERYRNQESCSESANQSEIKLAFCLGGSWDLLGLCWLPPAMALQIAGGKGEEKSLPRVLVHLSAACGISPCTKPSPVPLESQILPAAPRCCRGRECKLLFRGAVRYSGMKITSERVSVLLSGHPHSSPGSDTDLTHRNAKPKVRQLGSGATSRRKKFLTFRVALRVEESPLNINRHLHRSSS